MVEFLLQRPEFLVALDAIHVDNVVGIARDTLFPGDARQRHAVIEQGITQLQAHHLLALPEGETPILDRDLFATVSVVTSPDIAFMIVRNITGVGPQLFLEYISANLVTEQTFPGEGLHRLALLGNTSTLMPRVRTILSLPEIPDISDQHVQATLPQDDFFTVERLINERQHDQAANVLQRGIGETSIATRLLAALEQPAAQHNVALLRCRDGEVIDARNAAIVQDANTIWFIAQQVPGEQVLAITTPTADEVQRTLAHWYDELAAVR
jgi:hypothetical protein